MKVQRRIGELIDLFMAALHCDGTIVGEERAAARAIIADLMLCAVHELPREVEARIATFDVVSFDLEAAARAFLDDPPMSKRRLLELIRKMVDADQEHTFGEDVFISALAQALQMERHEYGDLLLEIEFEDEAEARAQMRQSFTELSVS